MNIKVTQADDSFMDWHALLELLHEAFLFMGDRIAPPSSLHLLTPDSIAAKAQHESLFLATHRAKLVGCVFATPKPDSLYVGKLAVHPDYQRNGIGRRLMDAVERYALSKGIQALELNTRIELTENHNTFKSMGYFVISEHSHEGYDRPTYISMRKALAQQHQHQQQ